MLYLYAGSFDPITKGHEWVIDNAPSNLIVAVANNPDKKYRFTIDERREMVVKHLNPAIEVITIGNEYLVDVARRFNVDYIIRGVRSAADYEYERAYADINRQISIFPIHLLMMPPPELASVSSSVVKSLIGPDGWETVVSRYVSPHVLEMLSKKAKG